MLTLVAASEDERKVFVSQHVLCVSRSAVNVPSRLLDCLEAQWAARAAGGASSGPAAVAEAPRPLLVHLSTDQVYDGSRAMWREADCHPPGAAPPSQPQPLQASRSSSSSSSGPPINAYGRSKLAAEVAVAGRWPARDTVILRSSIIYGPPPPLQPVGRPLFLQFVVSSRDGTRTVSLQATDERNNLLRFITQPPS